MSKSNKLLLPILGAVAIAGAGAGAFFLITRNQPVVTIGTDQPAPPAPVINAATVVPSNALVVLTVNTDGAALRQLETFLPEDARRVLNQTVNSLNQELVAANIDFATDIQPWAGGNVVMAILPPSTPTARRSLYSPVSFRDGTNWRTVQAQIETPTPPNFVIVAEVRDREAANRFLEASRAEAGGRAKTSEHKGVTITTPEAGAGQTPISSAFVNDNLVLSNQPASIQAVIDTAQGGESIANALPQAGLGVENPFVGFYVPNVRQNAEALTRLIPDVNALPPGTIEQLQSIESIGMVMGVDSRGVRVRSVTKYDSALPLPTGVAPNRVLTLLPGETIGVMTGVSIRAEWERTVQFAERSPEVRQAVETLRASALGEPLRLDLDRDILGWMDGEYSLALLPSSEGVLAGVGLGPVLMIQTSDRPRAERFLTRLNEVAQANGAQVATRDVGGVSVTEYTAPGAGALVSYGWVQPDTLFVSASPLVSLFAPRPSAPLTDAANFQSVLGGVARNGRGYFFLDMPKLMMIATRIAGGNVQFPDAVSVLNSIAGIGVSYVVPDPTTAQLDLLVSFRAR